MLFIEVKDFRYQGGKFMMAGNINFVTSFNILYLSYCKLISFLRTRLAKSSLVLPVFYPI